MKSSFPHFMCFGLAAVLVATFSQPVKADAVRENASMSLERCLDKDDARTGIMRAIMGCYTDALSRSDEALNSAYRSVMAGLSADKKLQLTAAERKWISDRDRICKNKANKEAGAGSQDASIILYGCLIKVTDERTEWLKAYPR